MASALDVFSKPSVITSELRSLNDFPDEILLQILKHFQPEDLLLIIAKVCERWYFLANDVILWTTLSYNCDRSSDVSRVAQVLTNAPALHSLIVRDRQDAARILEFLFHNRCGLSKLFLERCCLGKNDTGLLANIVDLYPDMEVLSLESCRPLTSAGYCLIPRLKNLSELNLSKCEGLSGKTVRLIADSCQHLKKLGLFGVRSIDDDDVLHVLKKLGKQLTTLFLYGGHLTDVAYSYLNYCTRLQELGVSFDRETTDRGLLEGIGSLHELTSLRLKGGFSLTAQALSTFLHRPSMTSIVLLNLIACFNLDDEGLKGIAKRCIHLKELAVNWPGDITDDGISVVIKECSQLRVLILKSIMYITGKGWLALVPSHLPHLRLLCLAESNWVPYMHVEELMAAIPEMKVIKDWDEIVRIKHMETTYKCCTTDLDDFLREMFLFDSKDCICKK